MAVSQEITLYNKTYTVPPVINAVQNDTDRQIVATLGDFTLASGMTAKLSFIRSDGTHYEATGTINTTNNTVTAELDQALTQVGICTAQIKVTETDGLGSTFTFIIKVQPDVAGISQQQDGYSAEELAQGIADNASAIANIENVELPKKADQDGYYEDLTSGTSLAVLGTPTTESVPYLFRRSASIGVRESDKIIGGTVAWNQLANVPNDTVTGGSGVTITYNSNGTVHYVSNGSNTALDGGGVFTSTSWGLEVVENHVYALVFGRVAVSGLKQKLYQSPSASWTGSDPIIVNEGIGDKIVKFSSGMKYAQWYFNISANTAVDITYKPQIFNLTQMLGSTIADYILGLEQNTAGSGIAKLKEWGFLTKDYYAYDSGSLQSVKTSAHIMRDADDNIIGDYPLDSSLELRGIPKLDGSNKLYYDGDTYASDGTVVRKYGSVNLGSLTWTRTNSGTDFYYFYADVSGKSAGNNIKCDTITLNESGQGYSVLNDKEMTGRLSNPTNIVYVRYDAYTTEASFKTAMNGVYLLYELATPTTETADPFHDPQICSPYGTEEYIDTRDVPVPVGHETEYYGDPVAEVERISVMIPTPPTNNGSYKLTCTVSGGVPTYSWTS